MCLHVVYLIFYHIIWRLFRGKLNDTKILLKCFFHVGLFLFFFHNYSKMKSILCIYFAIKYKAVILCSK